MGPAAFWEPEPAVTHAARQIPTVFLGSVPILAVCSRFCDSHSIGKKKSHWGLRAHRQTTANILHCSVNIHKSFKKYTWEFLDVMNSTVLLDSVSNRPHQHGIFDISIDVFQFENNFLSGTFNSDTSYILAMHKTHFISRTANFLFALLWTFSDLNQHFNI